MTRPDFRPTSGDRGGGTVIVILLGGLLSAIGLGLTAVSVTERALTGHYHAGLQLLNGADALVERVVLDLSGVAGWDAVLSGASVSAFMDAGVQPTSAWGEPMDPAGLTAALQQETGNGTAAAPLVWRLYACGSLETLGGDPRTGLAYLAAWVADDPSDVDGNPAVDTNSLVVVRAEARSPGGLRRGVQVIVERTPPADDGAEAPAGSGVRIVTWREVR